MIRLSRLKYQTLFSPLFFMLILLLNPPKADAHLYFNVMACMRSAAPTEAMIACGGAYISYRNDRMQLSLNQLDGLLPENRLYPQQSEYPENLIAVQQATHSRERSN